MRVGIVGDLHLPFEHPRYLEFCVDTFRDFKVRHVHLIGDIVDLHALGFWEHDPNGRSAEDEASIALRRVRDWKSSFRRATVSIGNHDARPFRVARRSGLPDRFLRSLGDVWHTGAWDWRDKHTFDGVVYEHGVGTSGKDAALNRAVQNRRSTVIGHVHSYAGCKWHANEDDRIFGLNVGCGIDIDAYAFAYAKPFPIRPVLGCGIVINGKQAFFVPMPIGKGEKYRRRKRDARIKT